MVFSQPNDLFGGVIQYDYGKRTTGREFERTGSLNKPSIMLLNRFNSLKADREFSGFEI